MTLDDVSKLLEAYDKLYYACRCLDHMHPPQAILSEMREVWRLKQEFGYEHAYPFGGGGMNAICDAVDVCNALRSGEAEGRIG